MTTKSTWLADDVTEVATERILEAAEALYADHGLNGISMDAVAARACCGRVNRGLAMLALDLGVLYYWYPGDYPSGFNSPDTGEVYAGVTFGPFASTTFSVKYSYSLTDLFGYPDSDGRGYLDGNVNWEFVPSWTLNVHGGKQWVENNEVAEYADWKVGVTKGFANGFSAALAYSDTDADEPFYTNAYDNFLGEDTVLLTVTKTF